MVKPTIPFSSDADLSRLSRPKMTPKDVRALARAPVSLTDSLNMPNPPNAAAGITPNSMLDGSKHEIPLAKIRPYDRNPRKSSNAAYEDIKASLSATGRDSLELWVTQRPGQDWYMPYRGGNTRLAAIQELFQKGDARWERLIVVYKVWVSEADTLAQHLIENNNRADMTFWDKACAYLVDMRAEIEQEVGGAVSIRRLEEELAKRGVGVGKSQIARFQFAVERLAKIGPYLSATQVIQLQPAINLLARLAEKFSIDDAGFQAVLDAVLDAQRAQLEAAEDKGAEGVRADALLPAVEAALAARLGGTPAEMRRWLDTLGRFPDASVDDLRNAPPAQPKKPAKTAAPSPASGSSSNEGDTGNTPGQSSLALDATAPASEAGQGSVPMTTGSTEEVAKAISGNVNMTIMHRVNEATGTSLAAAHALAQAAHVEDCLREYASMPDGFYMELPAEAIDVCAECPRTSHRIIAWQLLAVLSGQWDEATCRKLPMDSLWRRMRLCEGGLSPEALPMLVQDQLLVDIGGYSTPGAADLGWGPSVGIGWVVDLLTDPVCAGAAAGLLLHFTKREGV
ncbi:MAG: hypothetical protein KKG92_15260 [Gammaproteobacteria bacterium]|nr:hypothetical protein [Gammaproteobacteria bacterium]